MLRRPPSSRLHGFPVRVSAMPSFRRFIGPFFGIGIEKVPVLVPLYRLGYRIIARLGIRTLRVQGFSIVVDFRDYAITPTLWLRHGYEHVSSRAFRLLSAHSTCIIDVGAHVGYYTLIASNAMGPHGSVISFEPQPRSHHLLQMNLFLNGVRNVTVRQQAVSDTVGNARLYMHRTADSQSSLIPENVLEKAGSLDVEVITLDTAIPGICRLPVSVIKVDVQGLEAKVLRGGARIISQDHPAIFCEYNPLQLSRTGEIVPEKLLIDLQCQGYELLLSDELAHALRPSTPSALHRQCITEKPDGSGFVNFIAAMPHHMDQLSRSRLL
jgi:FkbM family methyltransferase